MQLYYVKLLAFKIPSAEQKCTEIELYFVAELFNMVQGENESRKLEIHGLKDILVRENEKLG